ncbi:sensor domain-containing diguanylate cyclase [Grimontia sp. NTOU-MAR1]|uniref:sensor domain-containing diguanylate cyclase n=1 Tax=Grimontia sp. NTOU-MAR1 TaxID=3111011 RepID=UPI002DB5A361|nr:GGDEF domain-containing protein [Grimontia sp. NTOU-MAR1]WRV98999.1 GGDEF domain-containing protein [Grimontia sp. NTOU-MAR1]
MELKDRYYTVLDSLPEHTFIFSESGIYIDVYGGEDNATGFDCKQFIGSSLYDVAPAELAETFHSYIKKALETNQVQLASYKFDTDNMIDLPDDVIAPEQIWFEATIKPIPLIENGERTVVWIAKNITERHLLEKRLKELSETDDLTGIANRRAFTERLRGALKQFQTDRTPFALLMLDIDHFKQINDSLGHYCGDEAIQFTVNLLNEKLTGSDFFGRIGGEEFAIILSHSGIESAYQKAEELRLSLESSRFVAEEKSIKLTVSIGVTEVRDSDDNIKSIMARADTAMYHSKKTGRNKVSRFSSCR